MGSTRMVVAAAALGAASVLSGAAASDPRPNLLLITVDTLRADRVGAYGAHDARTPNIDALAARGLRFDQAIAHAPLTFPSHVSILTGELPTSSGIRDNGSQVLGANIATVAQRLKTAGYQTGAFVSSFILNREFGLDRGFDTYDDRLPPGGPLIDFDLRRSGADTVATAGPWVAAHAAVPFFAWVHLYDPHAPYEHAASGRGAYDEAVTKADQAVGQLLQALVRAGVADHTVVVLTGDHGEGLGSHGEQQHGLLVYDSVMRVPLIVAGPSVPQAVVARQVRHVDIVPTLLAAAGVTTSGLPGSDLRRAPSGNGSSGYEPEAYGESWYGRVHFGWSELRFLRADHWKYIDGPDPELYDVAHDPQESVNLVAKRADLAAAMRKRLDGMSTTEGHAPVAPIESDTAERLRALGYVSGADPHTPWSRAGADPKRMIGSFEDYVTALESGIAELTENRPTAAVQRFTRLAHDYPDSFEAHHYLGYALAAAHRDAAAIPEYERALQLNPTYPVAYFDLARSLAAVGRHREAAAHVDAGVKLDPQSVYGAIAAGLVAWAGGDDKAARDAFQRASTLAPDEPRGFANLGEACMRAGDLDCASRAFSRLVALGYERAAAHFNLGVIAERTGRKPEAIAQYRLALADDPRLEPARQAIERLNLR